MQRNRAIRGDSIKTLEWHGRVGSSCYRYSSKSRKKLSDGGALSGKFLSIIEYKYGGRWSSPWTWYWEMLLSACIWNLRKCSSIGATYYQKHMLLHYRKIVPYAFEEDHCRCFNNQKYVWGKEIYQWHICTKGVHTIWQIKYIIMHHTLLEGCADFHNGCLMVVTFYDMYGCRMPSIGNWVMVG